MAHYDDNIMTRLNEQFRELTSIEEDLRRNKDELEHQLKEIRDSIVVAHRAVKTKQSEIHEYNNKFNPIGSLPSEILSLIFLDVVGFQVDHGFTLKAAYPTPPLLALVCRGWRNIVLGDPMLWTHLNIEHSHLRNLKLHISRSAGLPLDITLPLSEESRTLVRIRTVVREAHRWRRLWIDSSSLLEDEIRPLLSQKQAESLTYICLVNNRKRRHHIRPVFAPRQNHLRTLILIRTPMPKVLVTPRLQHLTFTGGWEDTHPELTVSYHRLRHILMSTTHLQTLGISVQSVVFRGKIEPILLPHLRHLTLYFHAHTIGPQLSELLDMISAPALQTIELTGEFKIRATYDASLYIKFVVDGMPRYPTVTTAILHNVIYSGDLNTKQFIESFPGIRSLTVNSFALPDFNSALQEPDCSASSSKSHWDSLQHIRVHVPEEWNEDFEASDTWDLCYLLQRRQKQGLPPLRLELVMDQKPPDEDHGEWLDELDSLSILTVVDAFEDTADAPWKFWANYSLSYW